jgi:hypothetical protein
MADVFDSTILWYRPELGKGSVRADNGRHYLFGRNDGVTDPVQGLRVRVHVDGSDIVVLPMPHGRREFAEAEPAPRKVPSRRRVESGDGAPKRAPSKPKADGPKSGPVPRAVRGSRAFAAGVSVRHEVHGPGFVVVSSPTVTRVRFLDGQERNCKAGDLTLLD